MMDARLVLFYLGFLAGLLCISLAAAFVWREIKESRQLPLGNRVGFFILVLFLIGFLLVGYPLYKLNPEYQRVEHVEINGPVSADAYPVLVYAVGGHDTLTSNGEFHLPVAFFNRDQEYRVLLVVNGRIIDEARAERRNTEGGKIVLRFRNVQVEPTPYVTAPPSPIPDKYK